MTDEMLRQAARDSCRAFVESLEADFDPRAAYVPSAAFRRKLRALCRRAEHPHLHAALRRAAAFLLVCLLSGGVWMARDAYAGVPENWVRIEETDGITYHFLGTEDGAALPVYRPGWIPEGYQIDSEIDGITGMYGAYYYNSEIGIGFSFDYQFMNSGTDIGVVGTSFTYEKSSVNGLPADYYAETRENESNNLFWFDQERNLIFSINSRLDRETIFRIAEGVTLTEVP